MIGWVMFGTNDLEKSTKFYDNFIEKLELVKTLDEKEFVGYAKKNEPEKVIFYITLPFDGGKASFGNGTMVAFKANSHEVVDMVLKLAIENGGVNEGKPGKREHYSDKYFSYFRDLDNNKICIYSES